MIELHGYSLAEKLMRVIRGRRACYSLLQLPARSFSIGIPGEAEEQGDEA